MSRLLHLMILLGGVFLWTCEATQACTSCGPECVPACGSRNYRACCFNYLRKRRSQGPPLPHDAQQPTFPWRVPLSAASEPSQSVVGAGVESGVGPQTDRDMEFELVLLPQRFSQDGSSRFHFPRESESSYQDNVPIGRYLGWTSMPPTPPSTDGRSAETDTEENLHDNEGETNQGSRSNEERHRQKPQEAFPWIAENRRRLHLAYSA